MIIAEVFVASGVLWMVEIGVRSFFGLQLVVGTGRKSSGAQEGLELFRRENA